MQMHMIVKDARCLGGGKTAWHLFTASCEFFPLLKFLGHSRVSIHHQVFDGAMKSSLQRLIKAQHAAYHEHAEQHEPAWQALDPLMDLVTCVLCAAHTGSNAMKWSVAHYSSEDVTKGMFIAIQSLRNSFTEITDRVAPFLHRNVAFQDDVYTNEDIEAFWTLLDIEPSWMDLFIKMDPHYWCQKIWVPFRQQQS